MSVMTHEYRAGVRRAMARTALAAILAVVTIALTLDPDWLDVFQPDVVPRASLRSAAVTIAVLATVAAAAAAGLAWRRISGD